MGKREWVDKEDLPPLPPREEWGDSKEFEKYTTTGKVRCQQFSKNRLRNGKRGGDAQCPLPAKPGTDRCRAHTRRKRTPQTLKQEFQRYKAYIPDHLLPKLLNAAQDPDSLALGYELDLITARIGEILERIDTKQSKIGWTNVQDAYDIINESIRTNDPDGIKNGMSLLRRALTSSDYLVWNDLVNMIHNRRVLAESERRRRLEQAQMISIEETMGLIAYIQETILAEVKEDAVRIRISEKFLTLVSPDVHQLPAVNPPKQRKPWWATHPNTRKDSGCALCRNEELRQRNQDDNGDFVCPECGTVWSMKVIDSEVS